MHYYGRKGEAITCINGHQIYVLDHDIPFKPLPSVAPVSNPEHCAPKCQCGAPYGRWTDDKHIELHFANGWRGYSEQSK